jgi:hypothetical protein
LVLETIGSIEEFARAVDRIEGMEWLAEWGEDDVEPDDDFYFEDSAGNRSNQVTLTSDEGACILLLAMDPSGLASWETAQRT